MKDVLDFIKHFNGAEDVFLHGCCFWFAFILQERFDGHKYLVSIFHDPIEGHFVAGFLPDSDNISSEKVRYFDIRGEVTDLYNEDDLESIYWMSINEERRYGRLMCDCKYFIEPEDYPYYLRVD